MATNDKKQTVSGTGTTVQFNTVGERILAAWSCSNWAGNTAALEFFSPALNKWLPVKDDNGNAITLTADDHRVLRGGMLYRINCTVYANPIDVGFDPLP